MAGEALAQAILQSLMQTNLNVLPSVPRGTKSPVWQADQLAMAQAAMGAGLPSFTATPTDSTARLRLMDAIARVGAAGFPAQHFIGLPNEPLGDRGVTMDIDSLVNSLQAQEQAAIKSKDKEALKSIQREKAFWQNELGQGMTAQEWKAQTGEDDPKR